jgi:hypothetical protein
MKKVLFILLLLSVNLFPQKLTTSAPTRLDLSHYYTDDLHIEIAVLDDSGDGFDFTGYTGTFNLKRDESTSAALKSFSVSFTDSIIVIDIDADSLTFLRAPRLLYYSLLLTYSGAPKTWLAGKFDYSVRPSDSQISSLTLAYSTTDLSLTIYGVSSFKDVLSDSLDDIRADHDTLATDVNQNAADIAAHRNIIDSLVAENYRLRNGDRVITNVSITEGDVIATDITLNQGVATDGAFLYVTPTHNTIEKRSLSDYTLIKSKTYVGLVGGLYYADGYIYTGAGTYTAPPNSSYITVLDTGLNLIETKDISAYCNYGINAIVKIGDIIYVGEAATNDPGYRKWYAFDKDFNYINEVYSSYTTTEKDAYQDATVVDGYIWTTDHLGYIIVFMVDEYGLFKKIYEINMARDSYEGIEYLNGEFILWSDLQDKILKKTIGYGYKSTGAIDSIAALTDNYYGVKFNADAFYFERTGKTRYAPVGEKPAEDLLDVHRLMKRCVVSDDGNLVYYLNPSNSNLKMNDSTANLDGTDGQVMVEIKKFYYQWDFDENGNFELNISKQPLYGFKVYPSFLDINGKEIESVYIGAYQAQLYDASAGTYIGNATNTYASGDMLASISGVKPHTNESRVEFRAAAAARGAGWQQLDYYLMTMIQILYLTEYANYDIQTTISKGNTQFAVSGYNVGVSGKSNSIGNYSSGQFTVGGDTSDYASYRGLENIYGTVWQHIDGASIYADGAGANTLYTTTHSSYFADGTADYHKVVGYLPNTINYGRSVINYSFIPEQVIGISSYMSDRFFPPTAEGWTVLTWGGASYHNLYAGLFCYATDRAASFAINTTGARLCFVP